METVFAGLQWEVGLVYLDDVKHCDRMRKSNAQVLSRETEKCVEYSQVDDQHYLDVSKAEYAKKWTLSEETCKPENSRSRRAETQTMASGF